MNHRIGRTLFAAAVGAVVAISAYQWASNPERREARVREEQVVAQSRRLLTTVLAPGLPGDALEIVDPLAPDRKVGKTYVYAEEPGWAVSGYYRRGENDRWHPYLLTMTRDLELVRLKVQDMGLAAVPDRHPKLVLTD